MDIGKLCLPTDLLYKDQRLDDTEWEKMKSHVELGINLLQKSADSPDSMIEIIRTHHERLNGGVAATPLVYRKVRSPCLDR